MTGNFVSLRSQYNLNFRSKTKKGKLTVVNIFERSYNFISDYIFCALYILLADRSN